MTGGFLAVAAGNYGAMALAFAISAVLARRLGTDRFGALALLMMASQVLSLFASSWTQIGFVGFGSREFTAGGTCADTLWARNWLVAPWAAAGAIALVIWRDGLAAYLGIPVWGLAIVYVQILAVYALTTFTGMFQAREEMPRYGTALFLDKAVTLATIALLPVGWIATPLRVLGAYAFSSAVVCIWCFWRIGWRALLPIRFDRAAYGQIWRFSLPLILSTWSGLLGTNWFDYVIIRQYLPLSDLGVYALASQLNGVAQQVTIIFSTLLLPRFAVMVQQNEEERIRTLVTRFLPYWFLGTSLLFGSVLILARPLVPLVFGGAFDQAVRPLAILMLATGALAFFNAFTPLMSAYSLTWRLALICFVSSLVNVAMDFALIPSFGIEGAAAATVLAYATSAALVLAVMHRRMGRVLHFVWLGAPVPIAAASVFLLDDGWLWYAAALAAMATSGLVLTRAFGLFGPGDRAFVNGFRLASCAAGGANRP